MEGGAKSGLAYDFMRRGFVRKVFGILSAQLLLTFAIAAPMVLVPSVTRFVADNSWIVGLASVASFALVLVLSFSESARHRCGFAVGVGVGCGVCAGWHLRWGVLSAAAASAEGWKAVSLSLMSHLSVPSIRLSGSSSSSSSKQ